MYRDQYEKYFPKDFIRQLEPVNKKFTPKPVPGEFFMLKVPNISICKSKAWATKDTHKYKYNKLQTKFFERYLYMKEKSSAVMGINISYGDGKSAPDGFIRKVHYLLDQK